MWEYLFCLSYLNPGPFLPDLMEVGCTESGELFYRYQEEGQNMCCLAIAHFPRGETWRFFYLPLPLFLTKEQNNPGQFKGSGCPNICANSQ